MRKLCIACVAAAVVAAIASSAPAGLLDYWDFNQTVGGSDTADDQGTNNLDLSLVGESIYATSTYNGASQTVLSLDGSGDFAKTTAGQPFGGGTSHTLTAWVKHDDAATGTLETYISWGSSSVSRYFFGTTQSWMKLGYGTGTVNVALPAVFDETDWHHYALTFDAGTQTTTMYLDGTPLGSSTATTGAAVTGGELRVGHQCTGNTEYLDGMIDDLAIFSGILTQAEIQAAMTNGPLSIPGPSSVLLVGIALLGLPVLRRRKMDRWI